MALGDAYPGIRPGTAFTPLWRRFLDDLRTSGISIDPTQSGGYNPRNIAGTGIPSLHGFDRAYDVNWRANPVGPQNPLADYTPYETDLEAPTRIPSWLARDVAQRHGLRWGGDFAGRSPDPMHFEVAPGGGVPAPPVQGRGLTAFAGMTPPMRGPAAAMLAPLAGAAAQPGAEPPFPPGAPLPGGMTIPPIGAPEAPQQPLGSNLLGLGRGILDWFSQPTPPGASGPPTSPPTLAGPPPSSSAPMGMPPMSAGGIGSDAVAAPVAPNVMVPPFATSTQPTPIDTDAIMSGAINAQAEREETERNRPGYFERLMTNPAFLAGLSILGTPPGGAWGPAGAQAITQAMRARREDTEYRRQQQQRRTMDRVWSDAFPGGQPNMQHPLLAGQAPQVAALLYTLGAETALPILARARMAGEKWDIKDGMLFNERTGQVLPIMGAGGKPPTGFRWAPDGTRLEPIPGGPGEHMPAELAGRRALMQTATRHMPAARDFYLNRMTVGSAAAHAVGGAMLSPEYSQAQRTADLAVESAIRAASGANAPEPEVQRYVRMFTPRVTDPIAVRRQKLDMLEQFMRSYEEAATAGRGGPIPTPLQGGGDFTIRRLP